MSQHISVLFTWFVNNYHAVIARIRKEKIWATFTTVSCCLKMNRSSLHPSYFTTDTLKKSSLHGQLFWSMFRALKILAQQFAPLCSRALHVSRVEAAHACTVYLMHLWSETTSLMWQHWQVLLFQKITSTENGHELYIPVYKTWYKYQVLIPQLHQGCDTTVLFIETRQLVARVTIAVTALFLSNHSLYRCKGVAVRTSLSGCNPCCKHIPEIVEFFR